MTENDKPHGPTGLDVLGVVEMDKTPQIDKLAAALAKAQASMTHADPSRTAAVTKDGTKKRKYATLADVMDAARPHLSANGLCVVQHPTTGNGSIVLTTWLIHESGQWMRSRMEFPRPDTDRMSLIQALGTALTYARRYAYAAITGVAVEDDDGDSAERPSEGGGSERADSRPVVAFPFGRNKDQPIQGAAPKDLEWYAKATRENIADPAKANFKERNEALLKALEAEIQRQSGPVASVPKDVAPYQQAVILGTKHGWLEDNVKHWLKTKRGKSGSATVTAEDVEALRVALEPPEMKGAPPPGDEDAPF